jgi:SAM-dependent methyltransferase
MGGRSAVSTAWNERVLPRLMDRSLRGHEIGEQRARACAGLTGRVLELGFGSGLNVRFYPEEVAYVGAVEPSDTAWSLSEERRRRSRVPVERIGLDGELLHAEDASFDSALSTLTLCTIPDLPTALAEVRRVLRPGGALHVLEHGLSPDPGVARWQYRLDGLQQRFMGGCHLVRDIPDLLEEAGFDASGLERDHLPGPAVSRPWTYGFLGRAVRR